MNEEHAKTNATAHTSMFIHVSLCEMVRSFVVGIVTLQPPSVSARLRQL
jgi:hypothetical protein